MGNFMKTLRVPSVIMLVFIATFLINKFMLSIEGNKIAGYGEKIEIKGKSINIVEKGLENNQVVIIDPGHGATAPGLDSTPLMDELFQTYHVIVIESFGHDDPDTIGSPRTIENITDELHRVTQKLGYTKYILRSHSISGVYSLCYLDKYQDEVTRLIGMDTSVPNQLEYADNTLFPILRKWSNKLGLIRTASRIHPEWFMANNQYYTDEIKSQIRYRLYRDFANVDNLDEGRHLTDDWNKIKDLHHSKDTKKIFFLTRKEGKDGDWGYIEIQNASEEIMIEYI